jgi:subtilisin family serine protease
MPSSEISSIQANQITAAFRDAALYPPGSQPGGTPPAEFFFRSGFLLTRERDQRDILNALAEEAPTFSFGNVRLETVVLDSHPIPGLARLRLVFESGKESASESETEPDGDDRLLAEAQITANVLEAIEQQFGPGKAAPEHLLSVTQNGPDAVSWCPATEPGYVPPGTPPLPGVSGSRCNGRGTLVAVVDEGLVPDAPLTHPWMHGVTGDPDELSPDGGPIKVYGGHGTFIASIIRAMAPRADVRVARVLKKAGAAYESDVVRELLTVLDWAPDVISLSAGTHTWESGGLLSFKIFVEGPLREHAGTVLVAAVGNDSADWKFSPAEMEPVIGVGALGSPGDARASFSNYGDWVKVYAPGQDLVHAFGHGTYTYQQQNIGQTADFKGMATWSGTSFSTPVVSGLIAARMSWTGESSREAADSLLQLARAQALPGVGPVLRPGQACLCLCEQPHRKTACH